MFGAFWLALGLGAAHAHDLTVDMLDVGQGDSILIRDGTRAVLIDAGDAPNDVADQLVALGVEKLSLVVASHPHADHIGGMKAVVDRIPIANYLDNHQPHTTATYQALMATIAGKLTTGLHYLEPGTDESRLTSVRQLTLGPDATFTVLFPLDGERLTGTRSDLNSNSVITRLDHGDDCFLFMGDAEAETERAVLNDGQGQCDVLKVAHHGSEYASTASFLNAVQPKVALISVGEGNRYHHPGPRTVERIQGTGARVYRTDLQGRITVTSSGHGIVVTTEKQAEVPLMSEVPAGIDTVVRLPGDGPVTAPGAPAPTGIAAARASRLRVAAPDEAPAMDSPVEPEVAAAGDDTAPSADAAPTADTAPTVDPTTSAGAPPVELCPFPASRSSEVFHEGGCGNAARISPNNYVCYATREAAIAAGKRPAGCCRP